MAFLGIDVAECIDVKYGRVFQLLRIQFLVIVSSLS